MNKTHESKIEEIVTSYEHMISGAQLPPSSWLRQACTELLTILSTEHTTQLEAERMRVREEEAREYNKIIDGIEVEHDHELHEAFRKGQEDGAVNRGERRRIVEQIRLEVTEEAVRKERESKNETYRERNMLVCALTKLFPAYLAQHDESDTTWERDWMWIVYIDLPTGQVSWHIHDSERVLFDHLEVKENNWDGHNTERKYQRLMALTALPPTSEERCENCLKDNPTVDVTNSCIFCKTYLGTPTNDKKES